MGNSASKSPLDEVDQELDFSSQTCDSESFEYSRNPIERDQQLQSILDANRDVFLPFHQIQLKEKLSDEFHSNVYRGHFGDGADNRKEVIVKIPFDQTFSLKAVKKLSKQAKRYVQLRHENIAQFYGFSLASQQLFVVTEYINGSILLEVLKTKFKNLTTSLLIKWATDVAKGMGYLSQQKIIHGNLCAGICSLSSTDVDTAIIKITDYIHPSEVGIEDLSVFAFRWVAPETIDTGGGDISSAGDVWSYGILLWELFSGGKQPYPNISSNLVLQEHLLRRSNNLHEFKKNG